MEVIKYIKNRKWRYLFNHMDLKGGDYVSIDGIGSGVVTDTFLTTVRLLVCEESFGCTPRSRVDIPYKRITGRLKYDISKKHDWDLFDFVLKDESVYCVSYIGRNETIFHGVLVKTFDSEKMSRLGRTFRI